MSIQLGRIVISEVALQKILDFLPYPFLVARMRDGISQVTYINQKFIEEISYTTDEIPTITEWFVKAYPDPVYRKQVAEGWASRIQIAQERGEDSVSMQVLIQTKYFKKRWYEVKASVSEPQMVAFIDIHAAKTQEENLVMLNENRDRVLSVLGHDLRAPMNQLFTLSQMALKKQINQDEFITKVADVNNRALQCMEFLSTTLTWARSNFDSIQIKKQEIHLRPIVEEVSALYEGSYLAKEIEMKILVDPSMKIIADREIIFTVLRNLISNAIKFTDQGGFIEISTFQDKKFTYIIVKDSGIGMDESTAQRILSKNYSSSIGTHGEMGLGIGIMLCNDLLKRMGASLQVESALGSGTSMKIEIEA